MLSAVLMLDAVRVAAREEGFSPVIGAGAALLATGTLAYKLGQDWSIVDALYFSLATLTTTSVADPDLVLDGGSMKIFTIVYQLLGIGILVEIVRRLGIAYVTARAEQSREPS